MCDCHTFIHEHIFYIMLVCVKLNVTLKVHTELQTSLTIFLFLGATPLIWASILELHLDPTKTNAKTLWWIIKWKQSLYYHTKIQKNRISWSSGLYSCFVFGRSWAQISVWGQVILTNEICGGFPQFHKANSRTAP
jgi:hypothetical protein